VPAPCLAPATLSWRNAASPTLGCERSLYPLLQLQPGEAGSASSLSASRLAAIEAAAAAFSLHLPAALSLRRQFLCAGLGAGTHAEGEAGDAGAHAQAFAAAAASFLAASGVPHAPPAAAGPASPHLFLNATINGRPVHWLHCVLPYGSPVLPSPALRKHVAALTAAYGPGACLFLCGFSRDLDLGSSVLLLNPGPMDLPQHLLLPFGM
jgi:hypothetical protein